MAQPSSALTQGFGSWSESLFLSLGFGVSTALSGQWADVIPCHLNQPRITSYSDNPRIVTHANQWRHDSRADQSRVTTEAD